MTNYDYSIYEQESYWRDGACGTGRGEWDHFKPIYAFFKKVFNFNRLLDVGGGCGAFVREGLVSESFCLESSFFAVRNPLPGAEGMMVPGSLYDIPFKDGFFDLVTAFNVMEHCEPNKVRKAFEELFRVTKKGHYVLCMLPVMEDERNSFDYIGQQVLTEKQADYVHRGHWCLHSRNWWEEKASGLGQLDLELEKNILSFTETLVGKDHTAWSTKFKGLMVFKHVE